jgi:sterol desaturase/sphingolipid hydroxylase (fatty acid hydroxylase superfamily)
MHGPSVEALGVPAVMGETGRPEFRFGEGRISGVLSVAFGALSLLAVLCFRFPELLTTPDLRAVYPVPLLRVVLFAALLLSLAFALASIVLSRRRALGLAGILFTGAAVALGGAWVEAEGPVEQTRYLGLDWFVLDLLVLALVFVPLERLFALRREQRILRVGFRADLAHFFVSHLLVQVTVLLTMAPAALFFRWAVLPGFQASVAAQPLALQFIEAVFLADLFQYGIHRLFHAVPWMWRFHAVHHSSGEMDWLAGSRLHLVDVVITRAVSFVPLFVMGFAELAILAYVVFVSFQAVLIHANVRFRFGWLGHVFTTPEFHHWHHAAEREAIDRNFAVHLPVIDRLFGTAWLPDRWPTAYGIEGSPVPEGWLAQLAHPFRRRSAADAAPAPRR